MTGCYRCGSKNLKENRHGQMICRSCDRPQPADNRPSKRDLPQQKVDGVKAQPCS